MAVSKSLYESVAKSICAVRSTVDHISGHAAVDSLTVELAEAFRKDNPRFNVEKFLDAAEATDLWEHVEGNNARIGAVNTSDEWEVAT